MRGALILPVPARLFLYVVAAYTLAHFGRFYILGWLGRIRPELPGSPIELLAIECIRIAAIFLPALAFSKIESRPLGVYGLPLAQSFLSRFWQGVLLGLIEVSVLVGLIAALGGYSFGALALHGATLLKWAAFWPIVFLAVAFYEEFAFRGYTQFTLASGIGFWPAAVILSFVFGCIHLLNQGEDWVGALSVVEVGLLLAFTLRRTGSLWLAVGLHASFDFGETFLFSVPDSGLVMPGQLSTAVLHGPAWLTGGSVGPEGSVFSFLTLAILFYAVHKLYPAKKEAQSSPPSKEQHSKD